MAAEDHRRGLYYDAYAPGPTASSDTCSHDQRAMAVDVRRRLLPIGADTSVLAKYLTTRINAAARARDGQSPPHDAELDFESEMLDTDREIEEIEIEEIEEDVEVPFAVIEDVPIFPGCESVAKSQRRACFQEQMNKHIRKNFRYPDIAQEMGIQGRVYVNFIISKDGSITNIRMRGPDKNLENEAARIIGRLPKMTPGKQRGRAVRVPFSIPITFRLQ